MLLYFPPPTAPTSNLSQVLAGVVTAADPKSRSYPDYVEEEIFAPLGLENCSIGWEGALPGLHTCFWISRCVQQGLALIVFRFLEANRNKVFASRHGPTCSNTHCHCGNLLCFLGPFQKPRLQSSAARQIGGSKPPVDP